jgi:ComF family protein
MRLFTFILDALFPPACTSCKKEGDFLCEDCISTLKMRPLSRPRPYEKPFDHLDGLIYGVDYHDNPAIKALLKQMKYKFTEELKDYAAVLLAARLRELVMAKGRPIVLIPIPLHESRERERGFNQAEIVAQALRAAAPKLPIEIEPLLERAFETRQQAKLNREDRLKNLSKAFILNKKCVQSSPAQNTLYFLVDDVATTGATLESAAETLKASGFPKIYGLTVAHAKNF